MNKISLARKFAAFNDHWSPKIVAELNGQHVKLAKLKGSFDWHRHPDEDELFWVIRGKLTLHLRDRTIILDAGEIFVVPRGVEHRPEAVEETEVVLFEPVETRNTGDVKNEKTLETLEWI